MKNLPSVKKDDIKVIAYHPTIINPEGISSNKSQDNWTIMPIEGVASEHIIYWISHDYEVVKGTWILEVWYKDKLMVSKQFTTI